MGTTILTIFGLTLIGIILTACLSYLSILCMVLIVRVIEIHDDPSLECPLSFQNYLGHFNNTPKWFKVCGWATLNFIWGYLFFVICYQLIRWAHPVKA